MMTGGGYMMIKTEEIGYIGLLETNLIILNQMIFLDMSCQVALPT